MRWIAALLASGPARKALGLMLGALTLALFLLNLRRAGESAGRLAERLQATEKISEAQRQMLEAATNRPRDRADLVERLRRGGF
jgi:type II secretory pathway component PulF